ncbi:FG-GAP-like repeat-containing protein [Streptomyces sp. NPDC086023]|uniref:FG-GAP-like repeat-containing protein n=1 Tax=Streptomyces sp. NPDC086023 TaxID=3365746 RepID=UPI0037D58C6E
MPRHTRVRRAVPALLALGLLAATSASFAGPGAAAAAATAVPPVTELVLDAPDPNAEPGDDRLLASGTTGFLHVPPGAGAPVWTRYADLLGVPLPATAPVPASPSQGWYGQGADLVALPNDDAPESLTLWRPDGAAPVTVDLQGREYVGTFGSTVITQDLSTSAVVLTDFPSGERRDRTVTGLPQGETVSVYVWPGGAGDTAGALLKYRVSEEGEFDDTRAGYVDFASAVLTDAFDATEEAMPLLDGTRAGLLDGPYLVTKGRTALTGPAKTASFEEENSELYQPKSAALLGDWVLIHGEYEALYAAPVAGGAERTVLPAALTALVPTPDGRVLAVGGTNAADWWVQRIGRAADGTPLPAKLAQVPGPGYRKTGIAISRGVLRVAEAHPALAPAARTSVWEVASTADGRLTASDRIPGSKTVALCPVASLECTPLWGNAGSGGDVVHRRTTVDGMEHHYLKTLDSSHSLSFGRTPGDALVDVSDGYVVFNTGGATPKQFVKRFVFYTEHETLLVRSVRAAALSSHILWSATTTAGRLERLNTLSGGPTTVETGASCVPKELQARGRWVYWSCGSAGPAGVFDTVSGSSKAAPAGDVMLGDGFTVRHDHTAKTLILTDARTGVSETLAALEPVKGMALDRRVRWAVDEYTNLVAWVDKDEKVHVKSAGVAPSPLAMVRNTVPAGVDPTADPAAWKFLLNRPVAFWSMAFTDLAGVPLRTLSGGARPGRFTVEWDGRSAAGAYAPNGGYRWTLKAVPYGTTSAVTVASGTGRISHGGAAPHDYGNFEQWPDGTGDVLAHTTTGGLRFVYGDGKGAFNGTATGSGWPAGIRPVPIKDMNGDRCNDLLVRNPAGELRRYTPSCGRAVTPSTANKLIGTGWNQYDVLTSPGDVTGDGRGDLVARNASTGALYLYARNADGVFAARTQVPGAYKGYKRITGAGDLNGDGHGDLVLHDTGNELWRMSGLGGGKFAAPVKLADNWGTAYNALVGVGDLTGDGRADLIARDTSGVVWRYAGTGKGTFGSRVRIATGWQVYAGLY